MRYSPAVRLATGPREVRGDGPVAESRASATRRPSGRRRTGRVGPGAVPVVASKGFPKSPFFRNFEVGRPTLFREWGSGRLSGSPEKDRRRNVTKRVYPDRPSYRTAERPVRTGDAIVRGGLARRLRAVFRVRASGVRGLQVNGPEVPDVRLTKATILVLERLLSRTPGDPVWGLEICRSADLGPSAVYPILARLRGRRWTSVTEETSDHPGRPARRFYQFTSTGRQKVIRALSERQSRMARDGIR